jgi:hypothetical protein
MGVKRERWLMGRDERGQARYSDTMLERGMTCVV